MDGIAPATKNLESVMQAKMEKESRHPDLWFILDQSVIISDKVNWNVDKQ